MLRVEGIQLGMRNIDLHYTYILNTQPTYLTVYGTLSSVDDRWGNNENTVVLGGYSKVDFGILYEPSERVKMQLAIDNVTDKMGITEGDPRNPTSPNGRYILPRSVKFSVSYAIF